MEQIFYPNILFKTYFFQMLKQQFERLNVLAWKLPFLDEFPSKSWKIFSVSPQILWAEPSKLCQVNMLLIKLFSTILLLFFPNRNFETNMASWICQSIFLYLKSINVWLQVNIFKDSRSLQSHKLHFQLDLNF